MQEIKQINFYLDLDLNSFSFPYPIKLNLERTKFTKAKFGKLMEKLKKDQRTEILELGYCNLKAEDIILLAEMLKENTQLKKINLNNIPIGSEGIKHISNGLKNNKTLTYLGLWLTKMGDEGTSHLSELLRENQTIQCLNIGYNEITHKGMEILFDSLSKNTTLTKLDLLLNEFDENGMRHLSEFIKNSNTLQKLNLITSGLNDELIKIFSDGFIFNKAISKLQFLDNEIGTDGIKYLCNALKNNTTLNNLVLGRNNINDEGIKYIAELLESNQILLDLNLHLADFTSVGAEFLGKSLSQNSTLKKLSISYIKIKDKGMSTFIRSLKLNNSLVELDLANTGMKDESAKEIAEYLKLNTSLQKLDISMNKFENSGYLIGEALSQNSTLKSLNLNSSQISNKASYSILNSLKTNTSLEYLKMSGCQIDKASFQCLLEMLKQNHSLKILSIENPDIFPDDHFKFIQESINENSSLIKFKFSNKKKENEQLYKKLLMNKEYQDCFIKDMERLFVNAEMTDLELSTLDEKILVHSFIFKMRLGNTMLNKLIEVAKSKTEQITRHFCKWIYTGFVINQQFQQDVFEFAQEIGMNEQEFESKSFKKGLINDLIKSYSNQEMNDFKIFVGENEFVEANKGILFARSGLFRSMFLSVKDSSNQVHDYNNKSKQSIQEFIKFLYFEEIDSSTPLNILQEMSEMDDYYQLSEQTSFGNNSTIFLFKNGKAIEYLNEEDSNQNPEKIQIEENIQKVTVGGLNEAILTKEGNVFAKGNDINTNNPKEFINISSLIEDTNDRIIQDIVSGYSSIYLLTSNQNVYGIGSNQYGQLGFDSETLEGTEKLILMMKNVSKIFSGIDSAHIFLLNSNQELFGCGDNSSSQIGLGKSRKEEESIQKLTKIQNIPKGKIIYIQCGSIHSIMLIENEDENQNPKRKLYSCGDYLYNGLGEDENAYEFTEIKSSLFENDDNIIDFSVGYTHTLILTSKGKLIVFGDNFYGQLGTGDTKNQLIPIQIELPKLRFNENISNYYLSCGFDNSFIYYSLPSFSNLEEDLIKLFERKEFCNISFKTENGEIIKAHKLILKYRLNQNQNEIEKLQKIISNKSIKESNQIFEMIYSNNSKINPKLYSEIKEIINSNEKIEETMKRIYLNENENEKDFIIEKKEKQYKFPKLILIMRSELYRGMFLSVTDDTSNKVTDYSELSNKSFQLFEYWIYSNQIKDEIEITQEIIEELEIGIDYFQLNQTNPNLLDLLINKFNNQN
ncbi:ynein regulatory complex subunit 5 [Anaeramoeba ignava]|uniref:Ynein regulatory complex subunit 5 n=1 Tax=Anaeramoeba ignava TaxID=1746090 RepID=A0A9Q0LPX6_ANAIG|nr:ynein regulatory complex subunit 5 [Anaeramoeba ignava]